MEIYFPAMFSGFNLVASIREGTTAKNKTKFTHGADLKGLTAMLNILVALVSSLGEAGLKMINPSGREEETGDFGELALLGHEAEEQWAQWNSRHRVLVSSFRFLMEKEI